MATQHRDDDDEYKGIKFSYSLQGTKNKFDGEASIYLHFGDARQTIKLELVKNDFETIGEAEDAIIKSAHYWIDKNKT